MSDTRHVEHSIDVDAPAGEIYRLVAGVENWPQIFPPTIHVEVLERSGDSERIQIWATANGDAKSWVSRRVLDPAAHRIEFRQEVSAPPVAAMSGTWIIEPAGAGSTVRLLHDYRAVDDDPAALEWIDQAVDRNSRAELAALKANVERVVGHGDLVLSFEDAVRIDARPADVFAFLDRAERWSDRLPHVAKVDLREDTPGLQLLSMDTRTKDGSTHTTTSWRVCFADRRIVYKQTVVPALMTLHTGYWDLRPDGDGTLATSQHTVILNPDTITTVLGPEATVDDARAFVRTALRGNSSATLLHAKAHAEERTSAGAGL
jgi:aromatase